MHKPTGPAACLVAVAAALLASVLYFAVSPASAAAGELDSGTAQRLQALDGAVDELTSNRSDFSPEQRSRRGDRINQAFVALTGEAVNPLFGVTTLGIYNYFRTPEALRPSLPLYDQPIVWAPLLALILLMLFNSTLCEVIPFLKVPLNALGDIVNKAGAVAVLPLVVKMFADAVAPAAGTHIASLANSVMPVAYAAEAGGGLSAAYLSLGWLAGAAIGVIVYAAVWLTANVIDVFILICPFPGVDAVLKSLRLSIIGALAGLNQLHPTAAIVLAVALALGSLLAACWSFRLSVFGWVFSTDILFGRRAKATLDGVDAFVSDGMASRFRIPMRTYGRLELSERRDLVFSYRPWLFAPRREITLGRPEDFSSGLGLLNPFIVENGRKDTPFLRLPPRYRGQEEAVKNSFSLRRTVSCGVSGTLRNWLSAEFFHKSRRSSPSDRDTY